MGKKRGQASLEYTFIVGIALIMIMPLIVIYQNHQTSIKDDVNVLQARKITESIVENAEKVHFIGSPSKTTIEVRMPDRIQQIDINGRKISFKIRTSESLIDVYRYADVNLSGSLEPLPGVREITITAKEDEVDIRSK